MSIMLMLNNFDLIPGLAQHSAHTQQENQTRWSTIANLAEVTYSLRMNQDVYFRRVTLADVDLSGTQVWLDYLRVAVPLWSLRSVGLTTRDPHLAQTWSRGTRRHNRSSQPLR